MADDKREPPKSKLPKFMQSLRARFLIWLMGTWLYRFMLRYVVPEITVFHAPGPAWDIRDKIRKEMRPGDMLLSKSRFKFTNLIIGGNFSHGAVVLEPDRIAEMSAKDFDVVDVDHFCKDTTRIALLRFKDHDHVYGQKVAEFALTLSNRLYDVRFTLGLKALYCSELCYQADYEQRMRADLSDLVGMGRPYISPDGIFAAPGLEVVYEWNDTRMKDDGENVE